MARFSGSTSGSACEISALAGHKLADYAMGLLLLPHTCKLSEVGYPRDMPYARGYLLNNRFFLLEPEQVNYTAEIEMLHDDTTKSA